MVTMCTSVEYVTHTVRNVNTRASDMCYIAYLYLDMLMLDINITKTNDMDDINCTKVSFQKMVWTLDKHYKILSKTYVS